MTPTSCSANRFSSLYASCENSRNSLCSPYVLPQLWGTSYGLKHNNNTAEHNVKKKKIYVPNSAGRIRKAINSAFLSRRLFGYYLPIASYGNIFAAAKWSSIGGLEAMVSKWLAQGHKGLTAHRCLFYFCFSSPNGLFCHAKKKQKGENWNFSKVKYAQLFHLKTF